MFPFMYIYIVATYREKVLKGEYKEIEESMSENIILWSRFQYDISIHTITEKPQNYRY